MDINRDASDKHKGIKLQKLRAIKLAFDTIITNPKTQFHIAIESDGDVFIYSDNRKFIEENKNYESKNFSFFSHQILNTLVYFLDYWLKDTVKKSPNVIFSFYSTNSISKEYSTEKVKNLNIELPEKPILELLNNKQWNLKNNLITICKKAILEEYENQYKGKNNNYLTLEALSNDEWESFFSQVIWNFEMPANDDLTNEVMTLIRNYATIKNINIDSKEAFILAMLRQRLEDKQDEGDTANRYLTDESLELIFHQIANQPINKNIYKYVDFDYDIFLQNITNFTSSFLKEKYFSVNNKKNLPKFLNRKVKKHNSEIKIQTSHLQETKPENLIKNIIVGDIDGFINNLQPVFLFGEIGSGKSSIIAQYVLNKNSTDSLCIMIPVNFIKGKITSDFISLFDCINHFINSNILIQVSFFNFEFIINNRPITIVFDGLDELNKQEARYVVRHLEKLSKDYSDVIIIGTGRPIELQSVINFNDWNCLTTIDLAESEVLEILINEAIVANVPSKNVLNDAIKRLDFLKSRNELSLLAKTPLVVCLLRDFLIEGVEEETLGTLMYKILLKRLEWDEIDLKTNYLNFFNEFPTAIQREEIIAIIAEKIFLSQTKQLKDVQLTQIIIDSLENIADKNKVIPETVLFYKNLFLQLNGNSYSFISQPLLEIAYSLKLAENIKDQTFSIELNDDNWRAFSFAIAINRLKGYVIESFNSVSNSLKKLLIYEDNVPIAAIIVSESKNSEFAELFINEISKLEFRPLKTWTEGGIFGGPDTYSPYAIAESIHLAGDSGFDWYFEEYLNPIHPIHTSEESQVKSILGSYFFINKFSLNEIKKSKLINIVDYHLAARTNSCNYFIPLLALIIPEKFDLKTRCIMLSQLLHHRLYNSKCKELLFHEINNGNKSIVLDALEIVVSNQEESNEETILFWLTNIVISNEINKTIVNKIIKNISNGKYKLYDELILKLPENDLVAYLRYCVLNNNDISDSAAILLYSKFNERDFYLITRPLLSKTQFYDLKHNDRIKILDDLVLNNTSISLNFFLKFIPKRKSNKDEIQETYIYYFNKLLKNVDEIHKQEFLYVVSKLPEYPILSRYPEIRNSYKELISSKPQYFDFLKESTQHLDLRLRFNANSILLACFPENAKKELENIIFSASSRIFDRDEWFRFCVRLNYSDDVLNYLKSILPQLPALSRHYTLFILYNHNINLSEDFLNELIEGLTGDGYFFDLGDPFKPQNDIKKVAKQKEFFPKLINILNGNNLDQAIRAAGMLVDYHYDKLSLFEQGKAYVFICESWERNLYNFDKYKKELFNKKDFLKGFDIANNIIKNEFGKVSLLKLYKDTIIDNQDFWLDFIKKLIYDDKFPDNHKIELFYRWLITLKKKTPNCTSKAGAAAKDLLSYPAIKDDHKFKSLYPYLYLIADEFDTLDKNEIEDILLNYECSDEIAASFLSKLGFIPNDFRPDYFLSSHIKIFSANKTKSVSKKDKTEIEKIFFDTENIPKNITEYIESIILFNIYTNEELTITEQKGNIACFIVSVVRFCRNENLSFKTILNAINEVGWPYYRNALSQSSRESLFIIKEKLLDSKESLDLYILELKSDIENKKKMIANPVVDNFKELFELEATIEFEYLNVLFDELINRPYSFNLNLMNNIFYFITAKLKEEDIEPLSSEIKKYINILTSNYSLKGINDEVIPLLWMFSLISFYLDKQEQEYSSLGFLKGLESIFIINTERNYNINEDKKIVMKGRDLMLYSNIIYEKIPSKIFQQVINNGASAGTPEIKAICIMLKGFIKV